MRNTFTRSDLESLGFIDIDDSFDQHSALHNGHVHILGHNFSHEAGHDEDAIGYFYMAYREKDLIIKSYCTRTRKLLSERPAPKYKFGISKNLKSRLERYQEKNQDMKIVYSWKIRAYKTLEKYIKRNIIDGVNDHFSFGEFEKYGRYHDGQIHNRSIWGMSEWMYFDKESAEEFARDVELRIVGTMMHKKRGRSDSFKMSHYINGKTDLYFDESKEFIDSIFSIKLSKAS